MSHTPLPWVQYGREIVGGEGTPQARVICILAEGHVSPAKPIEIGSPEWDQAMEDARVLRAAPVFLAALEFIAGQKDKTGNWAVEIARTALSVVKEESYAR